MICHIDYKGLTKQFIWLGVCTHCRMENNGTFFFPSQTRKAKRQPTEASTNRLVTISLVLTDCLVDEKFKMSHEKNSLPNVSGCFGWGILLTDNTINILAK